MQTSNKQSEKYIDYPRIGPGGINCPCCIPFSTKSECKKWLNRLRRNYYKRFIHKELKNYNEKSPA
ncbi:MAG: hypothetical protein NC191_04475 [Muribaculaceae bacterium]|nr:hypothetical protein [Muribaculaceae bacterium]